VNGTRLVALATAGCAPVIAHRRRPSAFQVAGRSGSAAHQILQRSCPNVADSPHTERRIAQSACADYRPSFGGAVSVRSRQGEVKNSRGVRRTGPRPARCRPSVVSRERRVRGWWKPTAPQGWTGIHRPFPSATRRPARQNARGEPAGPWLCAPASRRVCPFEEERCGARNAPAHAPGRATKTRPTVCCQDSRTTSPRTQISQDRNSCPLRRRVRVVLSPSSLRPRSNAGELLPVDEASPWLWTAVLVGGPRRAGPPGATGRSRAPRAPRPTAPDAPGNIPTSFLRCDPFPRNVKATRRPACPPRIARLS
jgi:hypothetical protein